MRFRDVDHLIRWMRVKEKTSVIKVKAKIDEGKIRKKRLNRE